MNAQEMGLSGNQAMPVDVLVPKASCRLTNLMPSSLFQLLLEPIFGQSSHI
jgi:hypothetical protein